MIKALKFTSCCLCVFCGLGVRPAHAADGESITINVPAAVSFYVDDVRNTTTGTPSPTTMIYSGAHLTAGHSFRLSAAASAATFLGPGGTQIPVSLVTWQVSSSIGGNGVSGTLDHVSYHSVFESFANPMSGRCDITFRLGALPARVRAGSHSVNIVWKVESLGY